MADEKRCWSFIKQNEELAEQLRLYACLFDKADKGYTEKDVVRNAQREVAEKS